MLYYLIKCSVILLCPLMILSCNAAIEKNPVKEKLRDTIAIVNNNSSPALKTFLKETVLNEKIIIAGKRLSASKKIDADGYRSLSIKMIDSSAGDENDFRYHVIDTLLLDQSIKVLLIGREYESENYIWITIYDNRNKLLDHKTVYYDNAEGFLAVETVIKNNQLIITTFNEYAEQEKDKKITEVYYLNENNKISLKVN